MTIKQSIDFKDPLWMMEWLQTALEKEKEKYEKCPVIPDMVGGVEIAQGWGYVIAGYFLVEESFKAHLHIRGKKVPREHSLSTLFELFDDEDKNILREYYTDYRATIGERRGAFPFDSVDEFLSNLDGGKNTRGKYVGSFDWRYFLIEEKRSSTMPLVSVDYLHEIVHGCIRIVEFVHFGRFDPTQYTLSCRMRSERRKKYHAWLTVRMNSKGWNELDDRLEILWGPDYRGRYDLYLFKRKGWKEYFSDIPRDFHLPIVDKREEIEVFDIDRGYRNMGVTSTTLSNMRPISPRGLP